LEISCGLYSPLLIADGVLVGEKRQSQLLRAIVTAHGPKAWVQLSVAETFAEAFEKALLQLQCYSVGLLHITRSHQGGRGRYLRTLTELRSYTLRMRCRSQEEKVKTSV
jgi:hypothetical protein